MTLVTLATEALFELQCIGAIIIIITIIHHNRHNYYLYKHTMKYQSNKTKLYVYYCIRATCFDS